MTERKQTKAKADSKTTTQRAAAAKKTKTPASPTRKRKAAAKEATSARSKTTTTTRKSTTRRGTTGKKKATTAATPHAGPRTLPAYARWLLTVAIVIAFGAGFYAICIRPYAYRWKPCYGFEGYGVCLPSGYTVHGLDLSHYQGDVDWTALATHRANRFPLRFVFIKATEGATHTDPRFNENFEAARQNGFIRGAYHYFIPQTDAAEQARHFINTVKLEDGDLPPVLDVEITGKRPTEELQEAVKVWMDTIEAHYGVKPILYTSYKFKRRHLDTPDINQYPYWIAHYYVDAVRYRGSWAFWQHTDVGRVEGIDGKVDLNVFNGTMQQLLGMTVSSEPTPADNEE